MAEKDAPPTEENSGDAVPARKPGGLLMLVLPPLLGGVVAFGIAFFDPLGTFGSSAPAAPEPHAEETAQETHHPVAEEKAALPSLLAEGEKPAKGKKGEAPTTYILMLEPIVLSLSAPDTPGYRAPRLRVGIGVEGYADTLGDPEVVKLMLRDRFTTAMRKLPPEVLNGTDGLEALRRALLDEAAATFGPEKVTGILITDFLMT